MNSDLLQDLVEAIIMDGFELGPGEYVELLVAITHGGFGCAIRL